MAVVARAQASDVESCAMTARIDLAGKQFGLWTVLSYGGSQRWICRCACGVEKSVDGHSLRRGASTRCTHCQDRSVQKEAATKHGGRSTKLYRIWRGMIKRCEYKKDIAYERYGGRGIVVCRRWRESFEAFRGDMGDPPPGMTLDRINGSGDYEPGNVRWATSKEQGRNRRTNRRLMFRGELLPMSEIAERVGMNYSKFQQRIHAGMSADEAAIDV